MTKKIYLDNNATTQIAQEVLEVITREIFPSNPSSIHFFGRRAQKMLMEARNDIASFLGIGKDNLLFTSGGTEAVNIAIRGLVENMPPSHIIASDIDHASVYNTLKYLEKKQFQISYNKVGKYGALKPKDILGSIKENTKLIVVSAVNSETGAITDINEIAKIAYDHNIHLAVDGVSLLGKEQFTIPKGITTMAFSSHKIHGSKGVGLCYVDSPSKISPIFFGGPQEYEKRAGTENLSGILGFAKAIKLLEKNLPWANEHMLKLREYFENQLLTKLKDISINATAPRVCNTSNICFKNIDAESLLILLDQNDILASHGSACSSGAMTASRTLINMGLSPQDARSSIRFSFSRYTTIEEIQKTVVVIHDLVSRLNK